MKAAVVIMMMVLLATAARATDYWYVAGITNDVTGTMFFVDAETVNKTGDTRTFWMTQVPLGSAAKSAKEAYATTEEEVNCEEDTKRPLAVSTFRKTGELIAQTHLTYQTYAIAKDSVDQEIEHFVCWSTSKMIQAQVFIQTHDDNAYVFAHNLWQRSNARR